MIVLKLDLHVNPETGEMRLSVAGKTNDLPEDDPRRHYLVVTQPWFCDCVVKELNETASLVGNPGL